MSAMEHTFTPGDAVPLSLRGPAPARIVAGFGFWLFLLTDFVLFAAFFAAYAVLSGQTASGPDGAALFNKPHVFIETLCLLASSVTCGLGSLAAQRFDRGGVYVWMALTFVLGAAFVSLELSEFGRMVAAGAGPSRSAFLSAFYALVGLHGLHVSAGLLWLVVMLAQVATLGFAPMVGRRLFAFSLFWHALDIVWIGVFTIVYLGAH
jgi:cytochrome o ubiquinol oxidase subunit III